MDRPFVAVDLYDEDSEFAHVNPNVIAYTKIVKTQGSSVSKEYPFTVETYLINNEVVDYYFKTKPEAKAFIRKLGDIK